MAKKMTIAEKMEKLKKELKRAEMFDIIMNDLEKTLKWNYMDYAKDEDGEVIRDECGEIVHKAPSEDDWRYENYVTFKGVMEEIADLL